MNDVIVLVTILAFDQLQVQHRSIFVCQDYSFLIVLFILPFLTQVTSWSSPLVDE